MDESVPLATYWSLRHIQFRLQQVARHGLIHGDIIVERGMVGLESGRGKRPFANQFHPKLPAHLPLGAVINGRSPSPLTSPHNPLVESSLSIVLIFLTTEGYLAVN
ncbi:MAG: hypothetical protein GY943_39405 [Chloroflexi bacterium]|nr:hypothetical protein [Chloroflexota bacterium]